MWSEVIRWMSSFAVSCDLLHILQMKHRPIPDLEPCHLQIIVELNQEGWKDLGAKPIKVAKLLAAVKKLL